MAEKELKKLSPLQEKIHEIIFEADTPTGKAFDVSLLIAIVASVIVVMLESVDSINAKFHDFFFVLEWIFTIFFTIEYILRLYSVRRPMKYATSFFGIIDLLAILPAFLELFIAGTHYLVVIRTLRLLRVFRIFKLTKFLKESSYIAKALRESREKITVFLVFVFLMVVIIGSVMYLIEGDHPDSGFTSIPRSIYWAIVTLTTVGYGDIAPSTELGQFLAAIVMIMGYAVIAVPTGIVSAKMTKNKANEDDIYHTVTTQACKSCSGEGHDHDAIYCKHCGDKLQLG